MSQKEIITIKSILEALQTDDSEKILKKKKLIAFIIDASKPKQVKGQGDYMQTIKIMDDSYEGYLTLFYFFKNLSEAAPVDTIGDIVFLKRYHYKLFNGEPQARRNGFKSSFFILYDALTLQIKFNPNESSMPLPEELEYIEKISQFSQEYLGKASLIDHFWYGTSNPIFDGLFQIIDFNEDEVYLRDSKNNQYKLICAQLKDLCNQKGKIIKIRNIQISFHNQILITNQSNLLLLPDYCYDYSNFDSIIQTFPKFDILKEEYESFTIGSATQIKRKYENLNPTALQSILNQQVQQNIVRVQGEILSILPTSAKDALIYYNKFKSYSYSEAINKELQTQGMQYTFQIYINIRDESLQYTNNVFSLLVFDNNNFFPFQILNDNIEYLEEEYQKFLEKLLIDQCFEQSNDFVIELIETPESVIFKIIDTRIVF